jgi:EpsG family
VLYFIVGRATTWIIIATFPYFLLALPETGADFSFYKEAYETVYYDVGSPLFFRSGSVLTAEAGWFLYTGLASYVVPQFRDFLVLNFFICTSIFLLACRILKISPKQFSLMMLLLLPVNMMVLMFWSPRSALPFSLIILAAACLQTGRNLSAIVLMVCAVSVHSQYAIVAVFLAVYFLLRKIPWIKDNLIFIGMALVSTFAMLFAFRNQIIPLLTFLPNFEIVSAKAKALDVESGVGSGFRFTSILSIIVFPAIIYSQKVKLQNTTYFELLVVFASTSLFMNVFFIDNPHFASRLSRASDYFIYSFLFSYLFVYSPSAVSVATVCSLVVILPFLFGDLYRVDEIFAWLI